MKKAKLNSPIILLAIFMAYQIGLCISTETGGGYRAKNNGVHIDEMYSYIFANSYDGNNISEIDSYWERWIDGHSIMETITVQKGERFSYNKVYYNNSVDCHPPLFYFLLHTICSLFPNKYTIWFGITLNIIFLVVEDILIYLLTKELTDHQMVSVLPTVLWGISFACMNTVMFVRMYMLLTVCTTGFLYITVKCIKQKLNLKLGLLLFLFSLSGVFTHYFFILFAFFITLFYCIRRFIKKDFREGVIFGATISLSVALLLIFYPYVITQATGSKTNNIGNEVSRSILNFSTLPDKITNFIKWFSLRFFNKYTFLLICAFAVLMLALYIEKNRHIKNEMNDNLTLIIQLIIVTMIVAITSLHVAGVYATERYIYNLYPIFAVLLISFTYKIIENLDNRKIFTAALSLIVLLNVGTFALKPRCDYLYETEKKIVEKIMDTNAKYCIVITANSPTTNRRSTIVPTCNVIRFNNFERIYLTTGDTMKDIDSILSDINYNDGTLIYLTTDKYWMDGYEPDEYMQRLIQQTDKFNNYEYIEDLEFGKLFLLESR
ncbi:MAG: hypothetical protein K2I95_08630 [Treponemataceae bacterium]|nr:hypothetical protein [Treponemataceae bacterium]